MLRKMTKFVAFPMVVIAATLLILLGLSSIDTLVPAPQTIDCEAMRGSKLVLCTYKNFQFRNIFESKRFTLTCPFDGENQTASWDEILDKISSQYAWISSRQRDATMLAEGMPIFSDVTLVSIPYVWVVIFCITALAVGIVLRPFLWTLAKGSFASASGVAAMSANTGRQPCSSNAEDSLLGGRTIIRDDEDNATLIQDEYEDNDFIDGDAGSEYEEDGISDSESESAYASDIDLGSDESEHEVDLVPAIVMVRPSHGYRAVRTMVNELERRARRA